jgi:hypothetical protein
MTGEGSIKIISKLFLNSLYGRFAMEKDFNLNIVTKSQKIKEIILKIFTNIMLNLINKNAVAFSFSKAPNIDLKKENLSLYKDSDSSYMKFCEN